MPSPQNSAALPASISLEKLAADLNAISLQASIGRVAPEFRVELVRTRTDGKQPDFANGRLEARIQLAESVFTVWIRWEAVPQALVENGWACREAPHMPGAGVISDVAILDEDEQPLSADGEELEGLAYDFFSYLDIEAIIAPHLPARSA